jgi:hypothetical protein
VPLPNARLAAATLFVVNAQGNSPTGSVNFTSLTGGGLRTYSGGQLNLQVNGVLAIENQATPPLLVQEATSVRDVSATLGTAPTGAPVTVAVTLNGSVYCTLSIAVGQTGSGTPIGGETLAPLPALGVLGLNVTSLMQTSGVHPGADLTVTIRL